MKTQVLLRQLKSSFLTLMYAKWRAHAAGEDMEYSDSISEFKRRFVAAWFAAQEKGLDPTTVCAHIIRRYWKASDQR